MLESASDYKRGDSLPVSPFKLAGQNRNQPSEFEVSFLNDNIRYQYGFACDSHRFVAEWLIAYPKGRAQRWFERAWNTETQEYDWSLGDNLTGERQIWLKSTRENALFLSTAIHLNSEQLRPVYDWFDIKLRVANLEGWSPGFTASLCQRSDKEKVLNFLKAADLSIDDIEIETIPFDSDSLPPGLPEKYRRAVLEDMKTAQVVDIKTVHLDEDGKRVSFDLGDESEGTQKLFAFAGPWIDSLANGYVLFIDELHGKLHPKLVQYLLSLFHNSKSNPLNAQLVFTTHETSILNQDVFRRDQVWFTEKSTNQATNLYPLTDFRPRKGRENLELAYLSGRYGALPFISEARV